MSIVLLFSEHPVILCTVGSVRSFESQNVNINFNEIILNILSYFVKLKWKRTFQRVEFLLIYQHLLASSSLRLSISLCFSSIIFFPFSTSPLPNSTTHLFVYILKIMVVIGPIQYFSTTGWMHSIIISAPTLEYTPKLLYLKCDNILHVNTFNIVTCCVSHPARPIHFFQIGDMKAK